MLNEIAEINGGSTPKTKIEEYWNGDIVWLSPTDLPEIGKIVRINDSDRKITEEGLNSCSANLLEPGTVIFSSRASIGKIAINEIPVATNQGFINFTCGDEIDNKYLAYVLKHYTDDIVQLSNSTTFKEVSKSAIKDFKIPLPKLSEQKAIVAKLDRAQRLIDIDREMLAKYDELIQSVFLEMFGDPVRNEKGWESVVFSKVFDITTGKLNANAAVEDGEYPFFTCSREISWIDNYAFDTEALLLAGNNASGDFNIKHYKGKFNAYQRTYVLTSEENYGFLKIALDYFLNQMKSDSIGTNTKYLTLKLLDRINIPIPPINLQNKFNNIITKIDGEKRIVNQQQVKKSEELFSSLVQGAFGD